MSAHTRASTGDSWRKALLPANATMEDAIRNLNDSALQIVLVVSDEGTLLGTITDGDIRRGLLHELSLSSSIDSVMRRDPMVVPPQLGRDSVLQLMRANKIHQMPTVDENRHVVGLHLLDDFMAPRHRPNLMVIMAGGRGTRLRPQTEDCPKPLLPVAGKPMLEHIIERACSEGFRHFVLAVGYLGYMIEDYFGDGSRWKAQIDYLREDVPLGTAGAISLLNPRPEGPFLVSNGDVLTDVHYGDLLDFHSRHGAVATMAVRLHEWQHPFGVVHTEGIDITGFDEKPVAVSHVNAGIYVLEPGAIDRLATREQCDMPTLFGRLQGQGARTIVYPMHEHWVDVGRLEDYAAANGKT